jgi:glycosyltransferase involved in cell wall biosynthesis
MRQRIAYVCADPGVPVFGRKGCSVHVQEMLRAFRGRGARVELFAMRRGGSPSPDLADVPVHELPRAVGRGVLRERGLQRVNGALVRALSEHGPFDWIYERHALWSFGAMEHAAARGIPGVLEVNAPLVEEQATHRELVDRPAAERMVARAFQAASLLLPVSRDLAAKLPLGPSLASKCHVVPNGVDPSRFAPASECHESDRPFTVGFVGSLRPWHGIDELAHAFASLRHSIRDARLLVVGDGPMRARLEAELEARGVREATQLAGALRPGEVPARLRQMDVAVAPYPARADRYFSPLKLLEYLAAGRAVVASRTGQVAEWIEHGRNGLLHAPGDTPGMVQLLVRLAREPALRRRLGAEARASVEREHTWDAIAERVTALAFAAECPLSAPEVA